MKQWKTRAAMAALLFAPGLAACAAASAQPPAVAAPTSAVSATPAPTATLVDPPPGPAVTAVPAVTAAAPLVAAPTARFGEPTEAPPATRAIVQVAAPLAGGAVTLTAVAPATATAPPAVAPTGNPTPTGSPATSPSPTSAPGGALAPPPFSPASSIPVTVNIDSTYPRNGPSWNAGAVGRMLKWSTYSAIARDAASEWFLVQDGTSRVWLHGSMIAYGADLGKLPVQQQGFTPGTLAPARVAAGLPAVSYRARQLYAQAVAAGRDPGMVTVIGDCNSEWQVYFGRFANGGYSLAGSGASFLQPVANQFANSFYRASLATHGSFNAAAALDPIWSDPRQCQAGETPLACELRVSRASVLVVALGTGDQFTWQSFEANLRGVIDRAILAKTLPILMTKADDLESLQGGAPAGYINGVMRRVGAQYEIPVIDLWAATRSLPQNGLAREVREDPAKGVIDQGAQRFHLSDDGLNARILLTLQTLNAVAR